LALPPFRDLPGHPRRRRPLLARVGEGAEVVAEITAAAILADAGLDLVAGWENDPWRSDPLYEVDPCEDPAPLG